jgi:oligopeptide/dipeptide ABC transporter ATP-binding protein
MAPAELLSLAGVSYHFSVTGGLLRRQVGAIQVLNGIDLSVREGEIFGLVGESGCGKTTLAKLLMKILEPSAGEIRLADRSLAEVSGRAARKQLYQDVQMVFQDPYSSLNPRLRVRSILGEMVRVQGVDGRQERQQVAAILADVGLGEDALSRHPHEFSGGQRQRIAIARALIVRPRLLVADEPVSALDLATQIQVLELLTGLQRKYGLTIVLISHDLKAVAATCQRLAVMYLGRLVEVIAGGNLFAEALHPYTRALVKSIPAGDPSLRHKPREIISGEVPSPLDLPTGCAFHPRCPLRQAECASTVPELVDRGQGHLVACHVV